MDIFDARIALGLTEIQLAGYSKRSLVEKLGIKAGFRILILNPPQNYRETLGELPENVTNEYKLINSFDFIQYFETQLNTFRKQLTVLKSHIRKNGMIWISWPKGRSGVETDLNEDRIRQEALKNGLVDVKVCAVDETWSGLKLVIRLKDR